MSIELKNVFAYEFRVFDTGHICGLFVVFSTKTLHIEGLVEIKKE